MATKDTNRNKEIRLIQIAKRQLNMDDDVYRGLLREVGGVDSSTRLDAAGRGRLLDRFARLGFVSTARAKRAAKGSMNVAPDRAKLLAKIDALLLSQGRDRRYVEEGMVQRICKVDSLSFCTPEQLVKLVAALQYDKKRHEAR
ncbi:regulatory protein GemA [Herbaspirillum sp. ST 5-3]|uniref:regulatory protein GemA n=1 Tax=Oxalobacteraceae TaxID=75682 RepID=UPI0010A42914|nr:regulatory protein GemA [Herbaspirillum sp. ST 5-3]